MLSNRSERRAIQRAELKKLKKEEKKQALNGLNSNRFNSKKYPKASHPIQLAYKKRENIQSTDTFTIEYIHLAPSYHDTDQDSVGSSLSSNEFETALVSPEESSDEDLKDYPLADKLSGMELASAGTGYPLIDKENGGIVVAESTELTGLKAMSLLELTDSFIEDRHAVRDFQDQHDRLDKSTVLLECITIAETQDLNGINKQSNDDGIMDSLDISFNKNTSIHDQNEVAIDGNAFRCQIVNPLELTAEPEAWKSKSSLISANDDVLVDTISGSSDNQCTFLPLGDYNQEHMYRACNTLGEKTIELRGNQEKEARAEAKTAQGKASSTPTLLLATPKPQNQATPSGSQSYTITSLRGSNSVEKKKKSVFTRVFRKESKKEPKKTSSGTKTEEKSENKKKWKIWKKL
ncbi:hypothetical protein BCV72DRAFT_302139 [Rhizopus microsporus var. microsporus]|uniref:Uncharacterized protein n=1 Tax=Rhizopus microsporus var. microsporus TaxID=86635 RepID=A0A1X0RE22_RHIZD|nr:hypothetical protein BCV72DRAFT_302139 [Rhizopus microsporus var. microsporus]